MREIIETLRVWREYFHSFLLEKKIAISPRIKMNDSICFSSRLLIDSIQPYIRESLNAKNYRNLFSIDRIFTFIFGRGIVAIL